MKEYPTRPLLVVCGAMSPSFMIRLEYFNMDFLIHLKCSIGRLAYVTYRSKKTKLHYSKKQNYIIHKTIAPLFQKSESRVLAEAGGKTEFFERDW